MNATRQLRAVTATAAELLAALPAALDATGPALLPVRDGPSHDGVLAAMRPDLPLERDDVALVVPTSGSTGEPKGVLLGSAALLASARATLERLGGPGQWLLTMPTTHIAGLQVLMRSLVGGVPPVVMDLREGFAPDGFVTAGAQLEPGLRHYTALVPTQLRRLVEAGVDLSSYAAVLVGGAALPFPASANVVRTYGMTETCGGCVYDGVPLRDVDVTVDADGRIAIGGPVLFAGYRLRPELASRSLVDGRFVTSDLGRWQDGRLEVHGRSDEIIVTGGVNVAPARVQSVLALHPKVRAVAVVGRPDPEWGERVVAVAVTSGTGLDLGDLREFGAQRLEPAELPRQLLVVDDLPMLASGKPDRTAVRSLVAAHPTA